MEIDRLKTQSYKHTAPLHILLRAIGYMPFIFTVARKMKRMHGDTNKAKVLIVHRGKLLLVKSTSEPHIWTLPGGAIKQGETASAAAVREIHEELGVTLHEVELDKIGTLKPRETLLKDEYTLFSATIESRVHVKLSIELIEASWFTIQDTPTDAHFINRPLVRSYLEKTKNYS